jgi:hypothetical protein
MDVTKYELSALQEFKAVVKLYIKCLYTHTCATPVPRNDLNLLHEFDAYRKTTKLLPIQQSIPSVAICSI